MAPHTSPSVVEEFYTKRDLFDTIIHALAAAGIAAENITRKDLAAMDEFHVRGQEVTREMAQAASLRPGMRVLDVGCGLGGPCRMLADQYGCIATGIDITAEFVETATRLSAYTGLAGRTHFVHGNALSMPFADAQFDVVWTQHVQMNIADKQRFYTEIARVLAPRRQFIYYDIFSTGNAPIHFPVPWASQAALSHLATTGTVHALLQTAGLLPVQTTNETEKGILFLKTLLDRIEQKGIPPFGLHLLMGNAAQEKLKNLLKNLEEEKIELESGICILSVG